MLQLLAPGVYVFGDHAYHNLEGCLPGYNQSLIALMTSTSPTIARQMGEVCTDHSHYRITSENKNRNVKLWGAVRGRSDARMHSDREFGHGTDSFKREVRVVWSLENMRNLGFFSDEAEPLLTFW